MADGFEVELDVLLGAAEGVSQTVEDMESCKVEDICGPPDEYGHDGLHGAFRHFCDRWQEGVEILLEDGDTIGKALQAAAAAYLESDNQAEDVLKGTGADPAAEVIDE